MKTLKTLFLSLILLISFNSTVSAKNDTLFLAVNSIYNTQGTLIGATYTVNIGDTLTFISNYSSQTSFKVNTTNFLFMNTSSTRTISVSGSDVPTINVSKYQNANGTGSLTLQGTINVNSGTATSLTETQNKIQFNIFPNPVVDELTINGTTKLGQVSVFDITGQVLFNEFVNETTTKLDFTKFSSGTYIVVVGNTTRKIIK